MKLLPPKRIEQSRTRARELLVKARRSWVAFREVIDRRTVERADTALRVCGELAGQSFLREGEYAGIAPSSLERATQLITELTRPRSRVDGVLGDIEGPEYVISEEEKSGLIVALRAVLDDLRHFQEIQSSLISRLIGESRFADHLSGYELISLVMGLNADTRVKFELLGDIHSAYSIWKDIGHEAIQAKANLVASLTGGERKDFIERLVERHVCGGDGWIVARALGIELLPYLVESFRNHIAVDTCANPTDGIMLAVHSIFDYHFDDGFLKTKDGTVDDFKTIVTAMIDILNMAEDNGWATVRLNSFFADAAKTAKKMGQSGWLLEQARKVKAPFSRHILSTEVHLFDKEIEELGGERARGRAHVVTNMYDRSDYRVAEIPLEELLVA